MKRLVLMALAWLLWTLPSVAEPQKVYVGVYLNAVTNFDVITNTYWMDFYVWFRWKGDLDPSVSFEFMNAAEKWGQTVVAETEEPQELDGGWKRQEFHIEQQFYTPLNFANYPLDNQALSFRIEDKSHPISELEYVVDPSSNYNPEIFIPGWKVIGQSPEIVVQSFKTNFGQPDRQQESYSEFVYQLNISRSPQILYLFKLLLPVAIILMTVCVTFFVPISFFESRVEISITGLLSLIALQIVLNETLPPVGYMTLTDKIYYFSYFVVLCALVETVMVYFFFKKDVRHARRLDRGSFAVMMVLTPIIFLVFFQSVR